MVISTEIIQSVMIPLLVAFAISVALSPFVIPFLRKLKFGQTERVEGVQSHLKKAGTPTMGGSIILISDRLVTCTVFCRADYPADHSGSVSDPGLWNHRIFWMTI